MMYTLWSRGELLGESELDYVRVFPLLRTGDLRVTPKGLIAFERLSQTHADSYHAVRRVNTGRSRGAVDPSDEETLHADLAAEYDQYDALALELRTPTGSVIATESIYVSDTQYLLAIANEHDDDIELSADEPLSADDLALVEDMVAQWEEDHPPWAQQAPEREPVRFQVHVTLKDQWSIP